MHLRCGSLYASFTRVQTRTERWFYKTSSEIQMLDSESVTSFLGRFTQIRDELAVIGEIVDLDFMVRMLSFELLLGFFSIY
jgi:hypothetical protein